MSASEKDLKTRLLRLRCAALRYLSALELPPRADPDARQALIDALEAERELDGPEIAP